jgi:hypothetical protein
MRTLSQIIDAAKSGHPATEEELRYALCALDSLATFDKMDLMKIGSREQEGRKVLGAWMYYEESFNRWKRALAVDPKTWLGPNNDPANPEYQRRRVVANKILDAAIAGKLPNQGKQ